jgi:hypothetical protein
MLPPLGGRHPLQHPLTLLGVTARRWEFQKL